MMQTFSRRALGGGLLALPAILSGRAEARGVEPLPALYPGTILVSTSRRRLYFALPGGQMLNYPVAVGKPGKQWFGQRVIDGKHVRPAWSPPEDVKRDNPHLPAVIAGGAANNPMGERALTISPGQYAIHGTNRPESIGAYASYGCIRMHNRDIIALFDRVAVGAPIIVVR